MKETTLKITFNDLHQSQLADSIISRRNFFASKNMKPYSKELSLDLPGAKQIISDWNNLEVSSNDLLASNNGSFKQIVLPSKFHLHNIAKCPKNRIKILLYNSSNAESTCFLKISCECLSDFWQALVAWIWK